MAPMYTGSLPPKKKSELQAIALALRISDQGTKDEIVQRITKHLDSNQDALEDNPTFTGLFARRKRSAQPQPISNSRLALGEKPQSSGRHYIALEPISESTPAKDLRNVSTFLKQPLSPEDYAPNQFPASAPSPVPLPSPAKSLIEHLQSAPVQSVVRQFREKEILESGNEIIVSLRCFLSNSRNIWSVTAIVELFYILTSIIPWQDFEIPFSKGEKRHSIPFVYPPLVVFQTSTFWLIILHWSIPALVIPGLIGCIISFNPSLSPTKYHPKESPVAPLDPLTASIIRLAAQISYPYSSIAAKTGIVGLDILGSKWRILSASVGLAFSFAEAIAGASLVLTDAVVRQGRLPLLRQADSELLSRRAITAPVEDTPDEVD